MNTTTYMTFDEAKKLLHRALQALSGVCDGARQHDGQGFNGRDARWGKQMAASNPAEWSPRAAFLVKRMLRIYTKQLASKGMDLSPVPEWADESAAQSHRAGTAQVSQQRGGEPVQCRPHRKITAKPEGWFCVEFAYEARLVELVKSLPYQSRQWNATGRNWLVNPARCATREERERAAKDLLRIGKENAFEFEPGVGDALLDALNATARQRAAENATLEASHAVDADVQIEGLGGDLYGYQRAGTVYLRAKERVLLGDEMGLGKTPQAIATLWAEKAYPAIIVCRANLVENWIREVRKWTPQVSLSTRAFAAADVLILTHHELTSKCEVLVQRGGWKAFVIDESQDFKNHKAKRTQSAKRITKECNPKFRFLLSGTPVLNRPAELLSQLDILGQLQTLGGWKHITTRYCGAHETRYGMDISGCCNAEEFNRNLRALCYIRRLKKDVLKDLPDKVRSVIPVEITNRAEYQSAEAGVLARLARLEAEAQQECEKHQAGLPGMDMAALVEFAKQEFSKVTVGMTLKWIEDANENAVRGELHHWLSQRVSDVANAKAIMLLTELKKVAARGKIASIVEHVETLTENGQKAITFAHHRETQESLATALPAAIWTRSSRFKTSQAAVDVFQQDARTMNIVCSLKGDNAGLNMTAASVVNFAELDWTPANHDQAEDRAHRIGQKDCVNAYYFIATGTVDEMIWDLLEEKRKITKDVSDGVAPAVKTQSIMPELLRRMRARG